MQVLCGETRCADDYGQQLLLCTLREYMYGDMCHSNRKDGWTLSYVHTVWEFKLVNMIMDMKPVVLSEFDRERIERST